MAKRYGPKNGRPVPLADYHQSKDNASEYPATTTEKVITTNLPNIFSYRSHVFAKKPELVQRYVKATKADVGGVGGHVVAADEVKGVITKFVLDNNSYQGEPMFTSLMVTHTGDDVAVTGITTEKVPNEVLDEVMWDALTEGANKASELGLYGPGQDLIADAFTGNLRGAGPASVVLPLPVRPDNPSQTVVVSFADKTEPMAFNYFATGAYLNPRFNSGLVIASSKMKRGYSSRSSTSTRRPRRSRPERTPATRRLSTGKWRSSPRVSRSGSSRSGGPRTSTTSRGSRARRASWWRASGAATTRTRPPSSATSSRRSGSTTSRLRRASRTGARTTR